MPIIASNGSVSNGSVSNGSVSNGSVSNGAVSSVAGLIRNNLNISVKDPDLDLFESGLLDSLGVVMLITALEEQLLWTLPLDDLELDNFRSVRRLAGYLEAAGAFVRLAS